MAQLQKQDLRVPTSLGGFMAWNRFHWGKLPIGDEHPWQWMEDCAKPEGPEQAWKWDLKTSIFAGEWSHANLQGVCGQFLQCENCLLLQTRNWSAQNNGFLDKNTIEIRFQKCSWDTLKTEELTEWLL